MSEPVREPRDYEGTARALVRLFAAVLAYGAAASVLLRVLGVRDAGAPVEPQILAHGGACAVLCAVAMWLPSSAALTPPRGLARAPLWYAAFLAVWLPSVLFGYAAALRALAVDFPPQPHLEYFAAVDWRAVPPWCALFIVVGVGPLAEEFVFRGYLRDLLLDLGGRRLAWWGTAISFGLFHGVLFALPIGMLGLLFGWLRERYDNLAPAFCAHALHNGLTIAATVAWPELLQEVYR